jgi:hypothetical protein
LRRTSMKPDGTFDPGKVQSWVDKHQEALAAFPEVRDSFRAAGRAQEAVNDAVAARKAAMDDYQNSAARNFLSDDPVRAIGKAFQSGNPVRSFAELRRMIGDDPDALAGLQRAAVDHINKITKSTAEAGDTGLPLFKSDAYQKFIRDNRPALEQIFPPEQVNMQVAIARDLQRANRSIAGTKLPGGSNTPQDLAGAAKHGGGKSGLGSLIGAEIVGEAVGHITAPGFGGAILRGVATGGTLLANAMRSHGLQTVNDLVDEAMLNPRLARQLLERVPIEDPAARAAYWQRVARQINGITMGASFAQTNQRREQEKRR